MPKLVIGRNVEERGSKRIVILVGSKRRMCVSGDRALVDMAMMCWATFLLEPLVLLVEEWEGSAVSFHPGLGVGRGRWWATQLVEDRKNNVKCQADGEGKYYVHGRQRK